MVSAVTASAVAVARRAPRVYDQAGGWLYWMPRVVVAQNVAVDNVARLVLHAGLDAPSGPPTREKHVGPAGSDTSGSISSSVSVVRWWLLAG